MVSKYIKTIQLFTELPTPNKNNYDGNCSIGIEPHKRLRPCSIGEPFINCCDCCLNRKIGLKLAGK